VDITTLSWDNVDDQDKRIAWGVLMSWLDFARRVCTTILPHCDFPTDVTINELCNSKAGELVLKITLAAEGKIEPTPENRNEIFVAVRELLSTLIPVEIFPHSGVLGEAGFTGPPYPTLVLYPIVKVGVNAWMWSFNTELITLTEASRICGKSLSSISQLVDRGHIRSFADPAERNPQRRVRVVKSEIEALKKK